MEEKILIETEKKPFAKVLPLVLTFAIIAALLVTIIASLSGDLYPEEILGVAFGGFLYTVILITIFFVIFNQSELTITDKRAFGKGVFGKRVDLPLDSISSIGTSNLFNRLSISSASGNLTFWFVENLDEFHNVLSQLLIERQSKANQAPEIKQEIPQSNADELKKYKELLDSGVISQEEFDAKKKQLLDL